MQCSSPPAVPRPPAPSHLPAAGLPTGRVSSGFCYRPVDSASADCYNASSWQSHNTASSSKAVDLARILKRQRWTRNAKSSIDLPIGKQEDSLQKARVTELVNLAKQRGTEKVEKFPRQEEDKKVFSMQGHRP
ncbi:hypothetical protein GUJ93_ZPchr0011g27706 [Zizania palustris]|uniref:Uncharacterized protein n=1 Tax=Zizania palustris TaxID=103762 RepID=A0A8J5WI56_ZIZPA|nr:hypothetical protein GUJ93_ZPchr0011g27706 [Zizania palustris]